MLKVKTYVDRSKISGLGLFAAEDIPKGYKVWEYSPLIDITFDEKKWNSLKSTIAPESFSMVQRYAYKEKGLYILCTDNAQFMNHSLDQTNVVDSDDLKTMYSLRVIKKDEELFCNYFNYSDKDDHHLKFINK